MAAKAKEPKGVTFATASLAQVREKRAAAAAAAAEAAAAEERAKAEAAAQLGPELRRKLIRENPEAAVLLGGYEVGEGRNTCSFVRLPRPLLNPTCASNLFVNSTGTVTGTDTVSTHTLATPRRQK